MISLLDVVRFSCYREVIENKSITEELLLKRGTHIKEVEFQREGLQRISALGINSKKGLKKLDL